ncbi:MAG: hypothetical protein EOP81_13475 [Variovorax sp.]|nr:MAG: hypothetical protein EOP81_13475 [Variovorax sp.]
MTRHFHRSRFFKLAASFAAGVLLLAACAPMPHANRSESASVAVTPSASVLEPAPARAPARLGTQWGEGLESKTRTVDIKRLSDRPEGLATIGYNDAASVRRDTGSNPERRLNLQLAQGDVEWSVEDQSGRPLPLLRAHRSNDGDGFKVSGSEGQRYTLRFRNLSDRRYEVLATVDGLDVLTGKPGSLRSGGYVLNPQESITIEGFRKSQNEVAAFRFAAQGRAYAANTPAGDVRNIGVIGSALFELEQPDAPRRPRGPSGQPNAFPGDGGYAPAPRYRTQ